MDKTQEDPYLIPAELEDAIRRRLSDLQIRSSQLQELRTEYASVGLLLARAARSPDQLLSYDFGRYTVQLPSETLIPVLRARYDELRTAIDEGLAR